MHIRITLSSNYYKYIYSNIITYLDTTFKEEQSDINYKINYFIKLVPISILFTKSVMANRLTKMLKGIMH
jgi:hypothetical protein